MKIFLIFQFYLLWSCVECACNRIKSTMGRAYQNSTVENPSGIQRQLGTHNSSILMATIAFKSANAAPIYLRTFVGQLPTEGIKQKTNDTNADVVESQELNETAFDDGQYEDAVEEEIAEDNTSADALVSDINAALIGRLCMVAEPMRNAFAEIQHNGTDKGNGMKAVIETGAYLECIALNAKEKVAFGMSNDAELGVWDLRECPKNLTFDALMQKCTPNLSIKVSNCAMPKTGDTALVPIFYFRELAAGSIAQGCYSQCHEAINLPRRITDKIGMPCSWLGSLLESDPASAHHFIQCIRHSNGSACGKWVRKECLGPGDTVFNPSLQLCVRSQHQNNSADGRKACPENSVKIQGRCANEFICPGRDSFCHENNCCLPLTIPLQFASSHNYGSSVVCLGSGTHPIGPCSPDCPSKYACQHGIGCCPQWRSNWDYPDTSADSFEHDEQISYLVCPGTDNVVPQGDCAHCPINQYCVPRLHGCCPHAKMVVDLASESSEQSEDFDIPTFRCPDGIRLGPRCSGFAEGCPTSFGCYRGFCCPMECPPNLVPTSFCPSSLIVPNNCAAIGGNCFHGVCCQTPPAMMPRLPVCATGQLARIACIGTAQCPNGFECSNGGCCPIPYCLNGVQAVGRCYGRLACPVASLCTEGLCCPLPMCPTGLVASRFCGIGPAAMECPSGQECLNGGCCRMPMIPVAPAVPVPVPVPMPFPVPFPVPVCSFSGSVPMSFCGMKQACPIGYFCDGTGCCPQPLPLCPLGGRALRACIRGADCPIGFGCTSLGGCCQLAIAGRPLCPFNQYPVCQCAAGVCPSGASCNHGICCSPNVALSFYTPGMRCRRSTDCQGAAVGFAECMRNICVCTNGAHSNGAQCVRPNFGLLRKARAGCDEFGSACRIHLIGALKQPMFAPEMRIPGIGNEQLNGTRTQHQQQIETPLWFNPVANTFEKRRCLNSTSLKGEEFLQVGTDFDMDSTCLPNEICILGICKLRLWPGDEGCTSDRECQSRCPNTYCAIAHNGIQNITSKVGRCLCHKSVLLFGRCFEHCPERFNKVEGECKPDNEDVFWQNKTFVALIQKELDKKSC